MAQSYNTQANPGAFVPTTYIIDPANFRDLDVNSQEFKELMVTLVQLVNDITLSVNLRDAGYYSLVEFLNGQLYFPNPDNSSTTGTMPSGAEFRQVFRTTIDFGELLNNTSKAVAHNIDVTQTYSFTRIYGTTTNTTRTSFLPIPYVSIGDTESIELEVTNDEVIITTNSDRSSYTVTYVVLEYIKS